MTFETNAVLPKMDNVFKIQPHPEVLRNLISSSRLRAIEILQRLMPEKIQSIQGIIKQEENPSSIWWKDQNIQLEYADIKMYQPPTTSLRAELTLTEKGITGNGNGHIHQDGARLIDRPLILPEDVVSTSRIGVDDTNEDERGKGVRPGGHWFEVLKVNKVQVRCMEFIIAWLRHVGISKRELEDLLVIVQDLRVWLELEVPVIEDGNSFGAEVQGHLVKEVSEAYRKAHMMSNGCRAHHDDRIKLAMEWAKYPNFHDFPAAIAQSDRYDHNLLRSYLRSLLHIYGGLLTKFERNWGKVVDPKGEANRHSGGMY